MTTIWVFFYNFLKRAGWTTAPSSPFSYEAVFSCEICKIFKNTYFEKHLETTDVMKYSFSAAVVQSCRVLHANLLKITHSIASIFQRIHHKYTTTILKNASRWLLLKTNLFLKHSYMAACQRQLQRYILFRNSYTYFTLHIFCIYYFDFTLKRNEFLWFF